jgi:hypothetical protein
MYDFYLGTPEEIAADERRYLVAIKRMMPRWINSLPDSEFLALIDLVEERANAARDAGRTFVGVETGAGASTLVFAYYAAKHEGRALSWDMNGAKGSEIRRVLVESMAGLFGAHIGDRWQLVAFDSLSPHLGLPVLGDLVDHVDLFFHDSEHVWTTVRDELEAVLPLVVDDGVVALDDANQSFVHTNIAYINTFRRKLGLSDVPDPAGNSGEPFYVAAERLLRERFGDVEHIDDLYKKRFRDDPYFAYYDAEFDVKAELGTERAEQLEHRFDSWRVRGYRAP